MVMFGLIAIATLQVVWEVQRNDRIAVTAISKIDDLNNLTFIRGDFIGVFMTEQPCGL